MARLNPVAPLLLTKMWSFDDGRARRAYRELSVVTVSGFRGAGGLFRHQVLLEGFTRSLAREVGELGITVNARRAGFLDTEMTHTLTDSEREQIARRSALRRMVEPDDVAGAVEYLLGDNARNITGITLTVDAGNTA